MNKDDEVLSLQLTEENAEYLIMNVVIAVFSCYQGEKDVNNLIEHPEKVEPEDFDHIALPQCEIRPAKKIIMDLQKLLY